MQNNLNVSIFSEAQVQLMLSSLEPFDKYLSQITSAHPNIVFAKDTLILLRGKLQAMVSERNYMLAFPLDANEVVILYHALLSYLFTMKSDNPEEKQRMMEDCHVLIAHFSPMVAASI